MGLRILRNSCSMPFATRCAASSRRARSAGGSPWSVMNETNPALEREVRVCPLQEHDGAIAKADEVRDMDEHPQQPRGKTSERGPPEIRHGAVAADGGHVALVEVPEWARLFPPDEAQDVIRRTTSALHRALCYARHQRTVRARHCRQVAHHEQFRVARHREVRLHLHAPGVVQWCTKQLAER